MKTQPLTMVVSLLCPPTATNSSHRHCRTLSASAKKPASLAGFLHLGLTFSPRTALFPACNLTFLQASLIPSSIQTPSSL